ncbi:hypothetical protein OAB94_01785 [Flavobacteriaceae bacterium]|nr:hypothetical protein [Flavobacteriaceae bacterium]
MALDNTKRFGRFTSSKIVALIKQGKIKMTDAELKIWKEENPKSAIKTKAGGFQAAGLTYIQEKQIEQRLGSRLDSDAYSRAMAWGNFMERIVQHNLIQQDLGYKLCSDATKIHDGKSFAAHWSGTSDVEYYKGKTLVRIAEIKCYQKKKFALYTDCILKQDVDLLKKDFPQEYWQIVSNCILNNVTTGEAISFMPFESEAQYIKDEAQAYEGSDMWKYRFIYEEEIYNLPFLKDGGYYNNINQFIFDVPKEDMEFLTSRVAEAINFMQ